MKGPTSALYSVIQTNHDYPPHYSLKLGRPLLPLLLQHPELQQDLMLLVQAQVPVPVLLAYEDEAYDATYAACDWRYWEY